MSLELYLFLVYGSLVAITYFSKVFLSVVLLFECLSLWTLLIISLTFSWACSPSFFMWSLAYLTMSVCKSVLGLSLLISNARYSLKYSENSMYFMGY